MGVPRRGRTLRTFRTLRTVPVQGRRSLRAPRTPRVLSEGAPGFAGGLLLGLASLVAAALRAPRGRTMPVSRGGGTGRRSGLKIPCPSGRAGSIPAPGTLVSHFQALLAIGDRLPGSLPIHGRRSRSPSQSSHCPTHCPSCRFRNPHATPIDLGRTGRSARWHHPCAGCAMLSAPSVYQRRSPGDTVLYRIIREHFETFRAQAAALRDGEGLPQGVEQAFRDFLRCGWLASGFARFRLRRLRIRSPGGLLVEGACALSEWWGPPVWQPLQSPAGASADSAS
jgi:hypothetical protein